MQRFRRLHLRVQLFFAVPLPLRLFCSKQISVAGIAISMNQPDVEATLCQCLLSLCQRAECPFCHNRFTCGRYRCRSHRRRLCWDRRNRTGRCHGRIEKPLSGLFPAFSSYSRHIRPKGIDRKHNSLVFQPASDGFQALPIVEGNLNLRPHRPQLPSLCEWLFSATRRKVPSCTSNPLIQAAFGLIVVHA